MSSDLMFSIMSKFLTGVSTVSYTHLWRTEPTNVEKLADDLWLGVKGQSNREIAGSPRKLFR